MADQERIGVHVRLPAKLVKKMKHHSIDRDQSIQAIIEAAVKSYLASPEANA